jgi:GntR family transcriptional regulator, carbon starvation induced regulator
MRHSDDSRTLADRTSDQIRAAILTGAFAPGSPLRPAGLAESLGVSPTVVRESLVRLTGEHIVQSDPHRGFRVRTLSADDLLDLTRVRVELECLALRWSIDRGDLQWESELVSAHHMYAATVRGLGDDVGRADELGAVHGRLHHAMVSACGSPHLLDVRTSLFGAAELYRRWTRYRRGVHRDVLSEHQAIVDACLSRDVALATSLMAAHIERTASLVLESFADGESESLRAGVGFADHRQ